MNTIPENQFAPSKIPYWEKIASETRWGQYIDAIEKRNILRASELCQQKQRVLEIGCEGGKWLKLLSSQGFDTLIGTDIDPAAITLCQQRLPQAQCLLVNLDDTRLPCDDQSVDLMLVMEIMPVIHSDWFYREAQRTLRPGGIVVGVVTNKYSVRALLYELFIRPRKRDEEYQRLYRTMYSKSYRYWKRMFVDHDFVVLHEEGYCWFPFPRTSSSVAIPVATTLEKIFGLRKCVTFAPWINFIVQKT